MVVAKHVCETAWRTARPTARRWLRLEMPGFRGISPLKTGRNAGTAMVARMNSVHVAGEVPDMAHAPASVRNALGADRVRRRLSAIFQRPIRGIRAPRIHGRSCQSPPGRRGW